MSGTRANRQARVIKVNYHYAERTTAWHVTARLFLPRTRVYAAECRRKAQVPERLDQQTKAEIALDELDQAGSCGDAMPARRATPITATS